MIFNAIEELKTTGFINYYGKTFLYKLNIINIRTSKIWYRYNYDFIINISFINLGSIHTYQIGISLLKSDYENAIKLLLYPREGGIFFS